MKNEDLEIIPVDYEKEFNKAMYVKQKQQAKKKKDKKIRPHNQEIKNNINYLVNSDNEDVGKKKKKEFF
jgi:hypothetical protein